jgi:DNA-binding LacI/PurR family transcriptional regulator
MEDSNLGLLLLPDTRFREAAARTVQAAAVDGFVVYSAARNDPRVRAALARRLPVVTVDQPRDAPTPFVGIDDRAAARSAAEHVRELGHERVGVVSFVSAVDAAGTLTVDLSIERLEGYREGLGAAWDERAVRIARRNDTRHARRAALELLDAADPPTAILAMSDVLALGVLQAAAERGLAVPAQLSVVGFDDSAAAALATPPLTTVAQPQEEKGRLAAQWLIEAIEHGSATRDRERRTILPTKLVVRNSTAER